MNIEDVLREMRQRIEDECDPGIENVKAWAEAIEAAMREVPPRFHITMPETQAVRLLQIREQELEAKLTVAREVLRGLYGKGARTNRIEDAERILDALAGKEGKE